MNTIKTTIITLAQQIQKQFPHFYLAGGTAIMLKYNHRISYDLDFFNFKEFSYNRLVKKVIPLYQNQIDKWERKEDNIDFFINGIKVSFGFFPFKNLEKIETIHEIKVAGDFDLFLNKPYVAGRRIDPKDPFDAAYLYNQHNWDNNYIIQGFEKKFKGQSYKIYLGALLSFEDYGELPAWIKETLMELIYQV